MPSNPEFLDDQKYGLAAAGVANGVFRVTSMRAELLQVSVHLQSPTDPNWLLQIYSDRGRTKQLWSSGAVTKQSEVFELTKYVRPEKDPAESATPMAGGIYYKLTNSSGQIHDFDLELVIRQP